jgi:hypothetical protein
MMRYQVVGADVETGQDRTIILDASSKADAHTRAGEMGVKVAQVRL